MAKTSPDVVREVASVMRHNLESVTHQEYAAAGGVHALAEILNAVDRTTERNILERLAEADSELADEVRALHFVFEDVLKLDDRAIQLVLGEIESKDLALALRGASSEVVDRLMANMSSRAAEMLAEEIEIMPPQRRKVVEESQSKVVAAVRRLEEAGEIFVSRGAERGRGRGTTRGRLDGCGRDPIRFPSSTAGGSTARRRAPISDDPGTRVERSRRQRGHDEGLAAGRALAEAELEPLRAALFGATAALGAAREEVIAVAEERAVELSVLLAQKIVTTALEVDPKVLLSVVEGALRHLVDADEVILEVNPEDVDLVEAELASLDRSTAGPKVMAVAGERRVGRGGCVVRTREREIDARLETQSSRRAGAILRRSLALPGSHGGHAARRSRSSKHSGLGSLPPERPRADGDRARDRGGWAPGGRRRALHDRAKPARRLGSGRGRRLPRGKRRC